jgi:mRNA-degrading endonuclease HigB of HigAB toxin-antitoxin module
MKKMKKTILFLVFAVAMLGVTAQVNSSPTPVHGVATLNENWLVTLPADQPLQSTYTLDVSKVRFTSPADMRKYFTSYDDDVISFRVDDKTGSVILHLDERYILDNKWKADEANSYFNTESESFRSAYDKMYK